MGKKKVRNTFDLKIPINDELIKKYIKFHYRSIQCLIKEVYFNRANPLNMSLKYDPLNPSLLFIIKDNNWISYDKDYILDILILEIGSKLYNYYINIIDIETYKKSLVNVETFKRIEEFMDEFNDFCTNGTNLWWVEQKKITLNFIIFLSKKKHK
jgi:hypothetical protein